MTVRATTKIPEISVKFPLSTRRITFPAISYKKNDFVWIRGNSGIGKSTFFLILKGIIPQYIYAEVTGQAPREFAQAVYLFQNPYSQIVTPTVMHELAFSLENLRFTRRAMFESIQEMAKLFEFEQLLDRTTANLSGGECQRLVLASSLAAKPEILLLDEPTAFLDVEAKNKFYEMLADLKGKYTIFLVDHNYREEMGLHDRIYEFGAQATAEPAISFNFEVCSKPAEVWLEDVEFAYEPGRPLLSHFNLRARGGEVVLVTGRNGAGKSTLLKLIAKIIKPQAGRVTVHGDFSFVFQNPESHFYFDTVKEELPPHSEHWLEHFGLADAVDRSPFSLSEGQKRRLTLLMAVLQDRSIILYDEPTFGQDPASAAKIYEIIRQLKRAGKLQIIISHDEQLIASDMVDQTFDFQ